jgi:hypothetical protein
MLTVVHIYKRNGKKIPRGTIPKGKIKTPFQSTHATSIRQQKRDARYTVCARVRNM